MKKIIIPIIVLIAIYYTWWIFFSGDNFATKNQNIPNKNSLINIQNTINLGDTYSTALEKYWKLKTDNLRLFVDNKNEWTIQTPLEFGATNWMLSIEFTNAVVSAVKIRTADGPAPKDGPKDKELKK